MKYVFLILSVLAFPAIAAKDSTFIYSKTLIRIIPKHAPRLTASTLTQAKKPLSATGIDPANMLPVLQRAPKEFTVEVRSLVFLKQTDFISHQPFTDREGMMVLIDPPQQISLEATRMIATADVLFADADGNIVKIAPDLKLSGLTEPIDSEAAIHAFIYLKAGSASANDIQIGDRIENPAFKTHPTVLE